jgi:hypothetical protein
VSAVPQRDDAMLKKSLMKEKARFTGLFAFSGARHGCEIFRPLTLPPGIPLPRRAGKELQTI